MYRITIIAIGKNKEEWVELSVQQYLKFLKRFADVTIKCLPDIRGCKNLSPERLRRAEAALISPRLGRNSVIALSDKGRLFDSRALSERLNAEFRHSAAIDFIIGGIHGLDKSILERARLVLALSPLTMSHQLVRPVLLEQLYRAFSIIHGGSYHK